VGALVLMAPQGPAAAAAGRQEAVTFSKHIAPLLQRSCQKCHRPGSIAPMSLLTWEDARPYARAMKFKTSLGPKPGVMPPWFIEKNVGIQEFKNDPSLSDEEIALIAAWADGGAPEGNPADLPPPITWSDGTAWEIGEPDLVVKSPTFSIAPSAPDWFGDIGSVPTGINEDRYIAAYQIREINNSRDQPQVVETAAKNTAGSFVMHHATVTTIAPNGTPMLAGCCNVHEVGRNAEFFDPDAGKLIEAGSRLAFSNSHIHANGRETTGYLEVGFKFHPRGYKPAAQSRNLFIGTSPELIDIPGMASNVRHEALYTLRENMKLTVFEPHMHAPGVRMCVEAIYGEEVQTLNCAGYEHSWVLAYTYAADAQPLLPRGTILRTIGYMDNSPKNPNVADPRNWTGAGHRSIDMMNIALWQGIALTDEQFHEALEERRQKLAVKEGGRVVGCPLCGPGQKLPALAGAEQPRPSGGQ